MVTHGTNRRIAAEQEDHALPGSTAHGKAHDLPLHKLAVCGELNAMTLHDSIRAWRFERQLTSGSGSNFSLRKKKQS